MGRNLRVARLVTDGRNDEREFFRGFCAIKDRATIIKHLCQHIWSKVDVYYSTAFFAVGSLFGPT